MKQEFQVVVSLLLSLYVCLSVSVSLSLSKLVAFCELDELEISSHLLVVLSTASQSVFDISVMMRKIKQMAG
jgi:hypothetical protein